jgi:hypothetical protein
MDELITGLNYSLSRYAFNSFEHQFGESNLPCFLRDELTTTMNDQFNTLKITSSVESQNQCDTFIKDLLSINIWGILEEKPEFETDAGDIGQNTSTSNQIINPVTSGWSLKQSLTFIYEKMVFHSLQENNLEQVSTKTFNWLYIIAKSMAGIQVELLQAAMNNIKTMKDNICEPLKSQEALDAMSDDDRATYIKLRSDMRQRFISAQLSYQVNIRLFKTTCQMLTNFFSAFSRPCREHTH